MTSPSPAIKRDIEAYSQEYLKCPFEQEITVKNRQALALAEMHRYPHRRILEVGCAMNPIFLNTDDYDYMTLVEPASDFFHHANLQKDNLPTERAKRITITQSFLEDIADDLRQQSFDFVFAHGVLHEVPDDAAFLSALHKAMQQGSVAFIKVPNAKSFHRLLAVEMGLINSEYEASEMQKQLQQPRVYDTDSLWQAVCNAGF